MLVSGLKKPISCVSFVQLQLSTMYLPNAVPRFRGLRKLMKSCGSKNELSRGKNAAKTSPTVHIPNISFTFQFRHALAKVSSSCKASGMGLHILHSDKLPVSQTDHIYNLWNYETGGEGGIRTLGDVNLIRLAGVRLKPTRPPLRTCWVGSIAKQALKVNTDRGFRLVRRGVQG